MTLCHRAPWIWACYACFCWTILLHQKRHLLGFHSPIDFSTHATAFSTRQMTYCSPWDVPGIDFVLIGFSIVNTVCALPRTCPSYAGIRQPTSFFVVMTMSLRIVWARSQEGVSERSLRPFTRELTGFL